MRRADNSTLHWQAEIEPTNRADLFRVTLECELPARGTTSGRKVRDSFLVLRPTWSDPAEREKLRASPAPSY